MSSILYGYLGCSTKTVLSLAVSHWGYLIFAKKQRAGQASFKLLLGHSNQSPQRSSLISSLINLHPKIYTHTNVEDK